MDVFMGWYLFDRHREARPSARVLYLPQNQPRFSPEEDALHKALTQAKHSVFELVKHRATPSCCATFPTARSTTCRHAVKAGSQGRRVRSGACFPKAKATVFANRLLLHPKEAYKFIESR